MKKYIYIVAASLLVAPTIFGQTTIDRQGEAGAYELLINPWARSAGLSGTNNAVVKGIEANQFNIAGLSGVKGTELNLSRTQYFGGTGISLNAAGLGQRVGTNGTFGISLMSLNLGKIPITTYTQPEGIGATFTPLFMNIGLGYSHEFSEKISCGLMVRSITEQISNASAQGVAFDAGVQYTAGEKNNMHIGISLKNVGTKLRFKGDGLAFTAVAAAGSSGASNGNAFNSTADRRGADLELPTQLNIGAGYDIYFAEDKQRLTFTGNFTSNSYAKEQYGLGLEYGYNNLLVVRAGYNYEDGSLKSDAINKSVMTGLGAGLSLQLPLKKGSEQRFSIDYGYQHTRIFNGNHYIGVRINIGGAKKKTQEEDTLEREIKEDETE